LVSTGSRLLFEHGYLEADRWDILNAFPHLSSKEAQIQLTDGSSEMSISGKETNTGKPGIVNTATESESLDDDVRSSKEK
jgi:hypothetical protein